VHQSWQNISLLDKVLQRKAGNYVRVEAELYQESMFES
jgi:hypothetical protein